MKMPLKNLIFVILKQHTSFNYMKKIAATAPSLQKAFSLCQAPKSDDKKKKAIAIQ